MRNASQAPAFYAGVLDFSTLYLILRCLLVSILINSKEEDEARVSSFLRGKRKPEEHRARALDTRLLMHYNEQA